MKRRKPGEAAGSTRRRLTPVPFAEVHLDDRFWAPRLEVNRTVTVPHIYEQCKRTGRIEAFKLAWKPGMAGEPHVFWDSDVAKWIEAAACTLAVHPDKRLEKRLDAVIDLMAKAQRKDGYLNVHFTVVEPKMRFKNLAARHELYCAGNLIEAGVAHSRATGKPRLLDVVRRYADYIDSVFGSETGKRDGCPGHEEIELALVKLYRETGESRYLKLAQFFLDQRGQTPSFYASEMENLGADFDTAYCQDHLPVREQSDVVGHAVRAMYLYCGMADVAGETGDAALVDACKRLWKSACRRRMYITGGIGPSKHNEGFTQDYDLPNGEAYAETCAAIGLVFFSHRMLNLTGDGRYADEMERVLYNGSISGVSLDGGKFFYVNPLASSGDHHRREWFECACCPPNISRMLAAFGQYVYSEGRNALYVHLYVQSSTEFSVGGQRVVVTQKTAYPWKDKVRITVRPERPAAFTLALRIPGWCRNAAVKLNGTPVDVTARAREGYLRIKREWRAGDRVDLTLPMPVGRIEARPEVRDNVGRVALQRGPVVYCLEQADNGPALDEIFLPRDAKLSVKFEKDSLGGVAVITGKAARRDTSGWSRSQLYRPAASKPKPVPIRAVPYCVWDNRKPGEMLVWVRQC